MQQALDQLLPRHEQPPRSGSPTRSCSASRGRCAPPGCRSPRTAPRATWRRWRWSGSTTRAATYVAGRATLCASPDDLARYDQVHEAYFNAPRRAAPAAAGRGERADVRRAAAGRGRRRRRRRVRRPGGARDGQRHRGAAAPRRRLDVGGREGTGWPRCSPPCARGPRGGVPPGTSAWHRGTVDAPRTLRASLRHMGEPADIAWRRRGNKPRRVVLLVDVSGSMSGYADALLRLAHRCTQAPAAWSRRSRSAPG